MIKWLPANKNEYGIETIAYVNIDEYGQYYRIIGYNGILKGDKVKLQNKTYIVVMVSRLGHMGLSENGELPYTLSVYPNSINKILYGVIICDWCEDLLLEEVYYLEKHSFTWSVCRDCLMHEVKK